jgi:hypothetical protein
MDSNKDREIQQNTLLSAVYQLIIDYKKDTTTECGIPDIVDNNNMDLYDIGKCNFDFDERYENLRSQLLETMYINLITSKEDLQAVSLQNIKKFGHDRIPEHYREHHIKQIMDTYCMVSSHANGLKPLDRNPA